VVGNTEQIVGKSKKREGLWKPKSEPVPNRTPVLHVLPLIQNAWSSEMYSLCAYLFMLLNFKLVVSWQMVDAEI